MRIFKTLFVTIGTIAIAAPVYAGTPTLAGTPSHGPAYAMEKGVKIYHTSGSQRTTIEKGVKVHRLIPAPGYYFDHSGKQVRSAFDDQVKIIKKRAKKKEKKAYKKGYSEGYDDGFQAAIETQRTRRPIRLRQRIRTRPRVSNRVLRRRNLQ